MKHTTMLVSAVLAGAALTAPALTTLDSSQFTRKCEMLKLPTAEDLDENGQIDFGGGGSWLTLGTGVNAGSSYMTMSGGQYLKADAASVGATGDVWRAMAATAGEGGTGYTVEARLKVTESTGSIGAMLLNASTGDSSINSWLVFRTDALYWGNGTDRKIMDIDATDWHNYRIVREPGSLLHSVFVDGTLVADDLPNGISASVNRIIMGSTGGAYKGKAQVAYLRFAKGAYAPPTPNDKSRRKASTDFPVQYEMKSDDELISPSANASDWKIGGSGATITKSGGILSVTTGGKSAYWDTQDAKWKNIVDADTPYTIEFRVKINKTTQSGADRAFNFMAGTYGPVGDLFVGTNSVQWCLNTSGTGTFLTLDASDNTDAMHSFRIAYSGGGRHAFTIWRDGVVIGENLVDCTNFYKLNTANALGIVRFGKGGGLNDGSWDLDYIRWDIGHVWDWKDPPKGFTMVIR